MMDSTGNVTLFEAEERNMKKQNDLPQWDLEAIYATPEAWEKDFI